MTQAGSGTTTLTGTNAYTGATTVNAGTLENSGSLSGTTSIAVNSGGTLLLSGAGGGNTKLNDAATMTLGGGKLSFSGITTSLDETVGTLTLSASSIIDFGTLAAGNTFRFANSSAISWTGTTLSIWNWSAGFDHLYFGANSSGLQQSQLDKIKFYSDGGTTILPFAPGFSAFTGSLGEVVPVPEPGAVATALGLLGLIGWRERRKSGRRSRHQTASL